MIRVATRIAQPIMALRALWRRGVRVRPTMTAAARWAGTEGDASGITYHDQYVSSVLTSTKTIAMVGASPNPGGKR